MLEAIHREQPTPDRVTLRTNGLWATIILAGCLAVAVVLALPRAVHSGREILVLALLIFAWWRFVRTAVIVNRDGITYRALHRTLRFPWATIAGFGLGSSGVTVVLESGREVWLMPTKPTALTKKRSTAEAKRTLELITERSPERQRGGPSDDSADEG